MNSHVKAVQFDTILDGVTRRADRSLAIRLSTQLEGSPELMAWLDGHHKGHLSVLLAEDQQADAEDYTGAKDDKGRTPSQKLRTEIWKHWKTLQDHNACNQEFAEFYDSEMGRIIDNYQSMP